MESETIRKITKGIHIFRNEVINKHHFICQALIGLNYPSILCRKKS